MQILFKILSIYLMVISLLLMSCSNNEELLSSDNSDVDINSARITVLQFPSVEEIISSQTVYNAAFAAWNEMLTYSTMYSRREIGFYIYYNRFDGSYRISEWFYGPLEPYSSGKPSSVVFGEVRFPYDLCAFFHCHPPMLTIPGRGTGESQTDKEAAYKLGVPGLLLDYGADYVDLFYHYEDEIPKLYVFGTSKRSDLIIY